MVNVIERAPAQTALTAGLAWLEQPERLDAPWPVHRIGSTLPDWVIGIHLADLDSDGDLDAVTGGYSGLNILKGSYSGLPGLRPARGGRNSHRGSHRLVPEPGGSHPALAPP